MDSACNMGSWWSQLVSSQLCRAQCWWSNPVHVYPNSEFFVLLLITSFEKFVLRIKWWQVRWTELGTDARTLQYLAGSCGCSSPNKIMIFDHIIWIFNIISSPNKIRIFHGTCLKKKNMYHAATHTPRWSPHQDDAKEGGDQVACCGHRYPQICFWWGRKNAILNWSRLLKIYPWPNMERSNLWLSNLWTFAWFIAYSYSKPYKYPVHESAICFKLQLSHLDWRVGGHSPSWKGAQTEHRLMKLFLNDTAWLGKFTPAAQLVHWAHGALNSALKRRGWTSPEFAGQEKMRPVVSHPLVRYILSQDPNTVRHVM